MGILFTVSQIYSGIVCLFLPETLCSLLNIPGSLIAFIYRIYVDSVVDQFLGVFSLYYFS